ncbi:MAG: type II pantothenate kinase [Prevotella sp.]|jgi:type II pantothenate kinase|nr:type II pantothenate kinase [Prevotella sp.]MCI1281148.1 type II pantothenate kinase [Prevotella sp.]
MGIVIGIDVGISTTKIVGINDEGIVISPIRIKATDPITSLYGAFGKYLHDNKVQLEDIEQVMLTGVGAAYIDGPIYGLPTAKAEEFIADGLGARYETELENMIVVSMGTGTSLVQCNGNNIRRVGGIGMGGGTLMGLSRIMLKTDDVKTITSLALQGDLANIDVEIGDISPNPLPGLPKDATASLFGNAKSNASREDIAKGIITTVLQTIGSCTILSSLGSGIREYVLIGNLTLLPQCREVFPGLEKLYKVHFIIPKYAEFCTAIGAALDYINRK